MRPSENRPAAGRGRIEGRAPIPRTNAHGEGRRGLEDARGPSFAAAAGAVAAAAAFVGPPIETAGGAVGRRADVHVSRARLRLRLYAPVPACCRVSALSRRLLTASPQRVHGAPAAARPPSRSLPRPLSASLPAPRHPPCASISLTSCNSVRTCGTATPSSPAAATTAPLIASISVRRPASTSCSIDGRCPRCSRIACSTFSRIRHSSTPTPFARATAATSATIASASAGPSSRAPSASTVPRVSAHSVLSAALKPTFSRIVAHTPVSIAQFKPARSSACALACTIGRIAPSALISLTQPAPCERTCAGPARSAGHVVTPTRIRSSGTYSASVSTLPSPFCSVSACVRGPKSARAPASAARVCSVFVNTITRSGGMPACAATPSGRSAASRATRRSPRSVSSRNPSRAIASTCAAFTSTSVTSCPHSASNPPNSEPIAPAPSIAILNAVISIVAIVSERIVARSRLHGDPAQIGELGDARLAAEVAEAAVLHAAERHLRLVVNGRPVHVADPRFDPRGNAHRARDVAAEHRRRQAERVVVRARDRRLLARDAHDALHRPERFLRVEAHRGRHAVDERRGHQRAVGLAAAAQHRAFRERVVDERVAALDGLRVDHRAEHDGPVARIAQRQRRGLVGELRDERVGDPLVDDDPLGRHADLPGIRERAERSRRDGRVEIGVVEHDERRLAAELEHGGLQMPRAALGDDPAHPRRAREVHAAHGRVRDHRVDDGAGIGGRVRHEVHDAARQPRFVQRVGDEAVRGRAQLRALEHHRVAACERQRERTHAEDHGCVPRRDAEHDARRLPHAHRERARHVGRNQLAADLRRQRGRLDEAVRGELDVEPCPDRRCARLGRHRGDERVALALERGSGLQQQRAARARAERGPRRERGGCGVHGRARVGGGRGGCARRELPVERIAALERRAARGRATLAADQHRDVLHACVLLLNAFQYSVMPVNAVARASGFGLFGPSGLCVLPASRVTRRRRRRRPARATRAPARARRTSAPRRSRARRRNRTRARATRNRDRAARCPAPARRRESRTRARNPAAPRSARCSGSRT
ncbi:hypothetical protein BURPS1710b_1050 [Burkholderia pseudomallei 1710b]|uniref:Uncharacterized protein n=1 Tax=Burkholderia pseudomallei (strain 1710b) TaxID=320372 RepID=Q3JVE2_BURP1|nr:hypothetical protein BURPS1710b_1050 [Burkholderia pseudomallei 1710b]